MFRRRHYAWVVAAATFVTLLGPAGFRSAPAFHLAGMLCIVAAGAVQLIKGRRPVGHAPTPVVPAGAPV